MCGHRGSGFAAVLALDDGAELLQGHTPLPYLQQSADDGPHHITEEPVRLDAKHQQAVLLQPACLHNLAVVGLHLGMHLRETRKVLILKEDIGSLLHLCDVQVAIKEIGIVDMEGVLRACDVIMVGARNGIETGMHLGRHLPNAIDDDVFWKEGIHLMRQGFRGGDRLLDIEMGVVVPGVDTRVGASAARDGDRLPQFEAQALLHCGLHAIGMRLNLVAMVTAAVIGQMDEISGHKLLFEGTKIEKKLMRNAECGMLNVLKGIPHSSFRIPHSKNSVFLQHNKLL